MATEIESAWLVRRLPDLSGLVPEHITQPYMAEPSSMRLRIVGDTYEMTKKVKRTKDITTEINTPLTEQEFLILRACFTRPLVKNRYRIPLPGGFVAELDLYEAPLAPHRRVEVEFGTVDEKFAFEPPDWFGPSLEDEKWASNARVAGKTYADIRPELVRLACLPESDRG